MQVLSREGRRQTFLRVHHRRRSEWHVDDGLVDEMVSIKLSIFLTPIALTHCAYLVSPRRLIVVLIPVKGFLKLPRQ